MQSEHPPGRVYCCVIPVSVLPWGLWLMARGPGRPNGKECSLLVGRAEQVVKPAIIILCGPTGSGLWVSLQEGVTKFFRRDKALTSPGDSFHI